MPAFRTDDPSDTINTPKEDQAMTDNQARADAKRDHLAIKEAEMDHREAMKPRTSRDARLDAIARDKRGDNAGTGSKDARQQMIDRMKENAQ